MRIALISDVHANLPALEAVLQHARRHRVHEVWGVGDWVGYGDFPDEVLQSLRQQGVKAISGNCDLAVLRVEDKRAEWGKDGPPADWQPIAWSYDRLSEQSHAYLRSLPPETRTEAQGRRILLRHELSISPREPLTADTPLARLRELAATIDADIVVTGHTHVPLARKADQVWFINPGSVGRPKAGGSRACYAILTLGQKRVQVRHYHVDYEKATLPGAQGGVPEAPRGVSTQPGTAQKQPDAAPAQAAPPESPEASPDKGDQVPAAVPALTTSGAQPAVSKAPADDRLQAVLQLARSCEYEEGHTHQVTRLALQLFDELQLVHGLGPRERYWLECSALLHDIGLIEGVQGHHKASLHIILDSPILTFDKKERLIIGSIARYHRAALPQERHRHFAALKPGLRRIVRILAAILRVADGLDYTHRSLVSELSCVLSPKQVLIRCAVQGPAEDERQRALQKGDLLEEVLERKLVIECREL